MTLPPELREKADSAAKNYGDEAFQHNPDGFHIAPWVNRETLPEAFIAGVEWLYGEISGAYWFEQYREGQLIIGTLEAKLKALTEAALAAVNDHDLTYEDASGNLDKLRQVLSHD